MEAIDVGWLSLIPPLLAIGLALITKEVISSLLIGIFVGTMIYVTHTGGGIVEAANVMFNLMSEKIGENAKKMAHISAAGTITDIVLGLIK